MYNIRFEPFGERLPDAAGARPAWRDGISGLGIMVFWTLVLVIVAARAVYFNPDVGASFFDAAAQSLSGLTRL